MSPLQIFATLRSYQNFDKMFESINKLKKMHMDSEKSINSVEVFKKG